MNVKGLLQVNAKQTTHTLLAHDFSVKLSLYTCVAIAVWLDDIYSSIVSMWDTYMCKCNCYSLRLPPGWCSVKNALGTCKEICRGGRWGEWGKGKTLNVFFWKREEERTGEELEGAKALTDYHGMYS